MKRRMMAFLLALILIVPLCAGAEGSEWTCPSCGQAGNAGNFCSNCGTPRPAADWTCPGCGRAGNTGNFCSNCGTPRPDASGAAPAAAPEAASPVAVNLRLEQIQGETDRVRVNPDRVEAAGYIVNKQIPDRWVPEHVNDLDLSTCWQFSTKKNKLKKTWIRLDLDGGETVDEVWFRNGFCYVNTEGFDQYALNSRLKEVKIEFLYAGESKFRDEVPLTLADERDSWQKFSVGRHENVAQVRLTVNSIYKGSEWPTDVCLAEFMLVQQAPAASATPARKVTASAVYESRPEITGVTLKMALATRSGPGTEYIDSHTFFIDDWEGQRVRVLKKHWDGSLWWGQVDFQNHKKAWYRVWTGIEKRLNVDPDKIREEKYIAECDIMPTSDTRFGPGGKYAEAGVTIPTYAVGVIYARENGYVDVEYWFENEGSVDPHRIWIPESAVFNLYTGDHSGEN